MMTRAQRNKPLDGSRGEVPSIVQRTELKAEQHVTVNDALLLVPLKPVDPIASARHVRALPIIGSC